MNSPTTEERSTASPPVATSSGNEPVRVLVVDDEQTLRDSCASLLRASGFEPAVCARGDDALRLVRNRTFDIILVDLFLPRISGLEILEAVRESSPETIVIVMTGKPSVESSVAALSAGAWDYLPKPFSATHFEILVGRAAHVVRGRRRTHQNTHEPPASTPAVAGDTILGESEALRAVMDLATRVAPTDASVFITGESGTGKEVIAQFIHKRSRRGHKDLVAVNCAAIPEALLESEMFGHVEGAFTGAVRSKEGLLEVADGSSLFLDELTELPLPTQAKLLRVLQDGVVRRVGSTKTDATVDVRFIAATNKNPFESIQNGDLRKDLHYRLRVVPIHIPPLRERPEDIPILATAFLQEFWAQHRGLSAPPARFSEDALTRLSRAPWPGNVRELRNVVEHAVVMAEPDSSIRAADLVFVDEPDQLTSATAQAPSPEAMDYHAARDHVLSQFEVGYLTQLVRDSGGNISDAARQAGVDRTTLYRLMEKHGIER
ncbi:MAG: sigma-54-dependent transcriptional regulator [Longimicrobiales bacterium]